MAVQVFLTALGLACVAHVHAFHRICDGGIEPDPNGFLASSNDKGPLETAVQRTDARYWFAKDGFLEHDEQVELITPTNGDGVDTVIKLCRPWEGECDQCPAIVAFDDNASQVVNGEYYYSKLPTLDWLNNVAKYSDKQMHRDPGRPERFRICVRSYWVEDPDECDGRLAEDCRGYFRATCRQVPLPGGGPDDPGFDNGDPAANGRKMMGFKA